MLGGPSIGVGYCAYGRLACIIYCAIAPIRKCGCEGRYHRDGVATLVCHVHKPVVGVEGNAKWTVSTGMVATTVFVAGSITETVLPRFVTYKTRCRG